MQQNSFFSKYKYIRALGHGGCGEVFLAKNIILDNMWAVKEITKGEKISVSGYIEPEILKRLNHPALPRICDVYEDENKIYIVEDYIEGKSLKQELDIKGCFDEQTVIDWAIQLCSVLEYLHCQKPNPIIYGDMKPHNIILTNEGFVKLIDFGISAMVCEESGKTIKNYAEYGRINCQSVIASNKPSYDTAFIGTKGYAAPEQFVGNGISRASDIYSLGITLIQLLTGIEPAKSLNVFQNEQYKEYLTPELFELLRKCVHPNPELRYQTAGILMKALRQYSLCTFIDSGNKVNKLEKSLALTKIIACTGARGTGVSTLTAAMAEYVARGSTPVCIVDLSPFSRFERSISGAGFKRSQSVNPVKGLSIIKEDLNSTLMIKISSNLYYINMNYLIEELPSNTLLFHKQLVQLQDSFSYIFIDADLTILRVIEPYLNHIFLISDMLPFNAVEMGQQLKVDGILAKCISRTSFIINKFYKGELSTRSILQSMLEEAAPQELQELIAYAKVLEVPYDHKVYIRWMYSFFGEPLKFKSTFNDYFGKKLLKIIETIVLPEKRRHFI